MIKLTEGYIGDFQVSYRKSFSGEGRIYHPLFKDTNIKTVIKLLSENLPYWPISYYIRTKALGNYRWLELANPNHPKYPPKLISRSFLDRDHHGSELSGLTISERLPITPWITK